MDYSDSVSPGATQGGSSALGQGWDPPRCLGLAKEILPRWPWKLRVCCLHRNRTPSGMQGRSTWGLCKNSCGLFLQELWEYVRLSMGCLREGPIHVAWGGARVGKQRDKGIKAVERVWTRAGRALCLLSGCPVSLLNSISKYFPGRGAPYAACACVYGWGLSASGWRRGRGSQRSCVCGTRNQKHQDVWVFPWGTAAPCVRVCIPNLSANFQPDELARRLRSGSWAWGRPWPWGQILEGPGGQQVGNWRVWRSEAVAGEIVSIPNACWEYLLNLTAGWA